MGEEREAGGEEKERKKEESGCKGEERRKVNKGDKDKRSEKADKRRGTGGSSLGDSAYLLLTPVSGSSGGGTEVGF